MAFFEYLCAVDHGAYYKLKYNGRTLNKLDKLKKKKDGTVIY